MVIEKNKPTQKKKKKTTKTKTLEYVLNITFNYNITCLGVANLSFDVDSTVVSITILVTSINFKAYFIDDSN